LTPRAKKALELSLREAARLGSGHIAAGHVLLGLLRARGGPDTRILTDADIDLDALRREVEAGLTQAA
jgi:ATP-dependent Clp protease ATP-binding subunit ClpA